ncbi:EamA-like transporter family protein [Ruegeria halocynthiae]|uniref:EamA-like transporter family protein n=1 Tax=Ruegeria halocynthiae TaxID=985054 RepID=A0A1H3EVF9_9RHOB|nr:DMT family transporter [Ruegeria halocynthiae]SDX82615.1 EamA-like transporter family protein [Ruegeria halocynthiae]
MRMTVVDWGLLGFLSILWAGTFFFTSIAVGELPPLTVVFLRVSIAALALLIYLGIRGITLPKNRQVWKAFLTMGILNNVIPFSLFFWAQTTIPGGLASIANAATPVFSIAVAHYMLADEKFTANKFFGVVLALIGVGFLFGEEVSSGASVAIS